MTDEDPQYSDEFDPVEPLPTHPSGLPPLGGGAPKTSGGKVTSGLAERKNPVGVWLKEAGAAVLKSIVKDPLRTGLILASLAITFAFFTMLDSTEPSSPGTETTLSEVQRLSSEKDITTAQLLDSDGRIVVLTKDGQQLWAAYPASGALTQELTNTLGKNGATVSVDQQSGKETKRIIVQFLLPILLLVCLFGLIMRLSADDGGGGIAAFSNFTGKGRKKGKGTAHQVTFADVAGAGDAVAELVEIRDYLADPSKYLDLGAAAPKGVLLVGPPGTGKTLLAKAVAGEAEASFFSLSGSDFVESLVGVGAARVRDLFRKARAASPAIIFIDEFDAAGRKRGAGIGQGNDEREQTLNQLLVEMDGFSGDGGLVVMGATNRPDILDPALLRPGRFDRQVTVDVPDVHGRLDILNLHGNKRPMAPDTSLEEIAKLTPGFSGAELANVVNEAALLTVREGRQMIDQHTLEEAIDRVVAGPARKHIMTEHERWIVAVHEASHAVVADCVGQVTQSRKISIVARGRSLGTAVHMLTDRDQILMQEPELERQLITMLAGTAGEKLEFGFVSTGVHDDLHAVTGLARSMVTSFGMSDQLGPVTVGEKAGEVFLGNSLQDLGSTGPETLNTIDREVERIVGDCFVMARIVLDDNWPIVHQTAQALLEHETLSGHALDALLAGIRKVNMHDLRAEAARRAAERDGEGRA